MQPQTQRRIDFDEASHRYRLNDQPAPGVTSILRTSLLFAGANPADVEAACQRGGAVHAAAFIVNTGRTIDATSIDIRIRPYVRAYLKFMHETGFEPRHAERFVSNLRLHYCGQLDIEGRFRKLRVPPADVETVEIKTTAAIPSTVGMQTAGYAAARDDEEGKRRRGRWCLWLRSNGAYELKPLRGPQDYTDFCAALIIWRKYGHRIN